MGGVGVGGGVGGGVGVGVGEADVKGDRVGGGSEVAVVVGGRVGGGVGVADVEGGGTEEVAGGSGLLSYKSTTLERPLTLQKTPAVARIRKQSLPHGIPKHKHPCSHNASCNRNQHSLKKQKKTILKNLLP